MAAEYRQYSEDPTKPRVSKLRGIVENPVTRKIGLSMARDSLSSGLPESSSIPTVVRTTLEGLHSRSETAYETYSRLCFEGDAQACAKAEKEEGKLMAYIDVGNKASGGAIIEHVQKITKVVGPNIILRPYEDQSS